MARSRFDGNDRVGPNPPLTTLVRRTAAQWRSMRMRPTFLLLSCIGWATGSAQLPNRLERILSAHDIPQANVSVVVQALGAERPVLAHYPLEPRNPASVMKLVTTWAALEVLGPAYTWPTEVYFLGDRSGWRLDGDLAIKGYGDPFLVTEELWKLLRAVQRMSVTEINGDLVIDDTVFVDAEGDPGEFDGDSFRAYNVMPNAMLVNLKAIRYHFGIHPGGDGVLLTADPLPDTLEIVNRLRLVGGRCRGYQAGITMDVRAGEAADTVVFSGDFPAACAPYVLTRSALRHDSYTYGVFAALWRELGGRHTGQWRREAVSEELEPVLVWGSLPLAEIIRKINKSSNNVMTRQLLYTLDLETSSSPGTRAGGIEVIHDHLAARGLNADSLVIDNGAGLSRRARISAQLLTDILQLAQESPYGAEYMASMSIGGLDGTTRRRFAGAQARGRSHVKTGSLDNVSAMAGYVHGPSGVTYAVAAMINATDSHRGPGEEFLDEMVNWAHELP